MRIGPGIDESKKRVYGSGLLTEKKKTASAPAGQADQASNRNILSKSDILVGKDRREIVHLKEYGKDVVIRPLTDGELTEVFEAIGKVPLNEYGVPDLNLVDISTNLRALRLITSIGMVEPKMAEDDVADMKFGVPGFLAKRILDLSGLGETAVQDGKNFR